MNLCPIAVFQAVAATEDYGRVILVGNLVLCLIVAAFWAWEAAAGRDDGGVLREKGRDVEVKSVKGQSWLQHTQAAPLR